MWKDVDRKPWKCLVLCFSVTLKLWFQYWTCFLAGHTTYIVMCCLELFVIHYGTLCPTVGELWLDAPSTSKSVNESWSYLSTHRNYGNWILHYGKQICEGVVCFFFYASKYVVTVRERSWLEFGMERLKKLSIGTRQEVSMRLFIMSREKCVIAGQLQKLYWVNERIIFCSPRKPNGQAVLLLIPPQATVKEFRVLLWTLKVKNTE